MSTNYRNKWPEMSNVPGHVDIIGDFSITTAGAVGTVYRPSAGSSPTALTSQSVTVGATTYTGLTVNPGQMFTVAQIAAYNSKTTQNVYLVRFTEQYLKFCGADANYKIALAADTDAGVSTVAVCSAYDSVSNGFLVFLVNSTSGAVLNSVASGSVKFTATFLNTISPASN